MDYLELAKINLTIARFAKAMFEKMEKKCAEGYSGWDKRENSLNIFGGFAEHCEEQLTNPTTENLVDIANYCMMLWYHAKEKGE